MAYRQLPWTLLKSNHLIAGIMLIILFSYPFTVSNTDFNKAYYPAAKSLLSKGTFEYTYPGFKNIPLVAYIFTPFAFFDKKTGGMLFLVIEKLMYYFAFLIFLKYLTKSAANKWFLFFLFLASRPFFIAIAYGQTTIPCFLLLVLMLITYLKDKSCFTGILLSLTFMLKIPIGL